MKYKFKIMIGAGGIGSGRFFALNGHHTLGREESRSGRFLDRQDYCKLHIISHYVKTILGSDFSVVPIGKIGDDYVGTVLYEEMRDAGLDIKYVTRSKGDSTLFSFCFIYPDNSGGNMTTDNSACSKVTPSYVEESREFFLKNKGKGIALAVPEVPMDARIKLLELGTEFDFFRIASFTSEEMPQVLKKGVLSQIDLLAINIDEAAALAQINVDGSITIGSIVEVAVELLRKHNPDIIVSVTAGVKGSWIWDKKNLLYMRICKTNVMSTAGAGDAFISGLISGMVAGFSFAEAQELGTLAGGLSVTSPHTINKKIDKTSLAEFSEKSGMGSVRVKQWLEEMQ